MTTLYHIEGFDLSKNLTDMFDYLKTDAQTQSIDKVENSLFDHLLKMGKNLLHQFLQQKSRKNKPLSITNKNNTTLPFHSMKKRKYLSIFGDIEIRRPYYWKAKSEGICPLDIELNMPKHHHSYLLDKWIQRRITEEPYEEAIESICDLLNQKTSKRLVQQITDKSARYVDEFYQKKNTFEGEGSHLVVQADCKGVRMIPKERPETKLTEEFERRAKGVSKIGTKKNAIVTSDYSINPTSRSPADILDGIMKINSNQKSNNKGKKKSETINKQVAGIMCDYEKAFENLADRVKARDEGCQKLIYILVDGASYLEKGIKKEFEKRGWANRVTACCLDIVHVTEYLWDASTAMYGEESPKRASWVKIALNKTLNSDIKLIIKELEEKLNDKEQSEFTKKRLQRSVNYFKNHLHMMDYKKYLKDGYPIASGAIEGACNNLIKNRTDRSGMQWTKKGAGAIINLRSVQCNRDWEDYWNYYIQRQAAELYGTEAA